MDSMEEERINVAGAVMSADDCTLADLWLDIYSMHLKTCARCREAGYPDKQETKKSKRCKDGAKFVQRIQKAYEDQDGSG